MEPSVPGGDPGGTPRWRGLDAPRTVGLAFGLGLVTFALLVPLFAGPSTSPNVHRLAGSFALATTNARGATGLTTASSTVAGALSLGVTTSPKSICAFGLSTCTAGTGLGRVTLSANAGSGGVVAWPNVQVAFVIETILYDGVYDPTAYDPGKDPCAQTPLGSAIPCEESNGVPFFVQNAQSIANAIQQANPHSQVSFAMVDYFYTCNFDDCDGKEYHVDLPSFVPSGSFGGEVQATFQTAVLGGGWVYSDSDFSDNVLHSSVITAMYGTIVGSGLNWANNTHHVIVWMGSSAPRDPSYPENYCVSADDNFFGVGCIGATCEPSFQFAAGTSPNCEGWVRSQDGNATHSIAMLAKTAKQCTGSIGGVCTVDTIDLWDTATDPYSKGWSIPNPPSGGGPGGTIVQQNVANVLRAGCDMAAATGGTWNGPSWYSCADGQAGSLVYYDHGPYNKPKTSNPELLNAFRGIGFGPILETQVASGANRPLFEYVPIGNIALPPAAQIQGTAACYRGGQPLRSCQTTPSILHIDGIEELGWNWSTNKTTNVLYVGDQWTASFNVMATGPPYTTVPVDACVTAACHSVGSGAVNGQYTSATYVPYTNNSVVTESFPVAQITVLFTPAVLGPPAAPPPPPPAPPPFPIPAPQPIPVIQQIGIGNQVGVAQVSLQATAAGFLGAGFMRVSLKNRPIAMKVAAKSGAITSRFEKATAGDTGIGHFE